MQQFEQLGLEGYDLDKATLIGQGNYAKLFKIRSNKRDTDVALKQIDMDKLRKQNQLRSLVNEIEIMKQLKCDNVVEFIESQIGQKYSYIVMELCDGDLRKKIMTSKNHHLTESQAINIFGEIVKGLKFFVQNSYIHRDLKPQNILLRGNTYKITDFGFTVKADLHCQKKLNDVCGTPIYMAPQLLNNQPYTAKCDIWSLGLMLYEMIYGSTPWPVKCVQNYKSVLKKRPLAFPFDVKIGKETKSFIKKALSIQEQGRMSWKQLFQHPLIKEKFTGEVIIPVNIDPKIRRLLSNIQHDAKRKLIDIIQIFRNYDSLKTLNYQQFFHLMSQLNPTISTYETRLIFEACDKNNNKQIQKNEFRQMFCQVNFHANPKSQKQIDEIFGIICAKQLDVKELFQKFDINNSGTLNFEQLCQLIRHIAPSYDLNGIKVVFQKIDSNHDGQITKNQFIHSVGGGVVNQKNYVGLWLQKVIRNMKALKTEIQQMKLSAMTAIKLGDSNKDEQLDFKEFTHLMNVIGFPISPEEIHDIFKVLDNDNSGKISLEELEDYVD